MLPEDIEILILRKYMQMEILPLIKKNKYKSNLTVQKELKINAEQIINSLIAEDTDIEDPTNRKRLDELMHILVDLHERNIFTLF